MSVPAVTVLMPVFNGARHLPEAIASVLKQRFRDFELLVIDDGSTDETSEILHTLEDRRVRILRNDGNLGLVAALNRGLAEARGELIARQDADDVSEPDRLDEQVSFARGNPAVPLIGSDASLIDDAGRWCGRWRTGGHGDLVAWDLCFRAPFAHGSAFFRRKIIMERLGGYRDRPACEDLDLWARVAKTFPVVTLRQPLVKYRQHAASIMAASGKADARKRAVREILESHMAHVAPGLNDDARACIAGVWSDESERPRWDEYFEALKALELGFFRGRRSAPGFRRLMADQHYTVFFRARRAGEAKSFLSALARANPTILPRMPWLRMLASSFRR